MSKAKVEKKAAEKIEKKATEKAEPKKAKKSPFTKDGKGVIQTIVEILSKTKSPLSQNAIHEALVKEFPHRDPAGLLATVRAQLVGQTACRLEKEKKLKLIRDEKGNLMLKK